ncbi:hypothetical protein [Nocardiopsis sp. HUAS JQ3]|uniref:hypothetical protein n=1 Tax=Nocardiopsis sp. HUAS JQ3 TaxID=3061629 RepID=UPI0023A91FFF|nr:hypothetical protein [Nocardiopsis sp. HUAS JQ3]WDZ91573.1 hypothetical protein PV789_03105 [Nocardiopsis sp. HUAS JQ3]
MNKEAEINATNRIGHILLQAAPHGWQEIECTVAMVNNMGQIWSHAVMPDGVKHDFYIPAELSVQFRSLRSAMYIPEKGTWFSAKYTLAPPSSFRVGYNFDHEKEFSQPRPDAVDYYEDLQEFPRSAENMPPWLQEKANEAEALTNTPRREP